jgi:hypothetical protein
MRAIVLLPALACLTFAAAQQKPTEPDPKTVETIQARLEQEIDTRPYQKEMPLSKFLEALESQLPKKSKVALRIDRDAFGSKFSEVIATPVVLPPLPKKRSLRSALDIGIAKIKTRADYRIGSGEVSITTPERALYTHLYDIRQLVAKPIFFGPAKPIFFGPTGLEVRFGEKAQRDTTIKAEKVIWSLVSLLDGNPVAPDQESIDVLDGTRLKIHTNASRHAQIANLLRTFQKSIVEITVSVKATLFEVDTGFYQRLKNVKRVSLDELERLFIRGISSERDALFGLLKTQKIVQVGDLKVDPGQQITLLSRHRAVTCGPTPERLKDGIKDLKTILEGVSFQGVISVSRDRRSVRVRFVERSSDIQEIRKMKVVVAFDKNGNEKVEYAEIPFVKEASYTQVLEIPDGGTILTPVHYRPPSHQKMDRGWVVAITARISIEDEERMIMIDEHPGAILPNLLTDVLTNPKLKAIRDLYGTPGDKRFALADSPALKWPEHFRPAIPGFQLVPAKRVGKRLLGIRLDAYDWKGEDSSTFRISLLNVGGDVNGAVAGVCTLRYSVRAGKKGTILKLGEDGGP